MYGASYNVVKTMYMLLHSAAGVKYKLQDETTVYCNANEYMKDHIYLNWGEIYEKYTILRLIVAVIHTQLKQL